MTKDDACIALNNITKVLTRGILLFILRLMDTKSCLIKLLLCLQLRLKNFYCLKIEHSVGFYLYTLSFPSEKHCKLGYFSTHTWAWAGQSVPPWSTWPTPSCLYWWSTESVRMVSHNPQWLEHSNSGRAQYRGSRGKSKRAGWLREINTRFAKTQSIFLQSAVRRFVEVKYLVFGTKWGIFWNKW